MKKENANGHLHPEVVEMNSELKAYFHQQVSEFEPFFLPDSEMSAKVEKVIDGSEFNVTLTLTGGGSFVQALGKDKDVYEAMRKAKDDLLSHLFEIQKKISESDSRDQLVEDLMRHGSIYVH